MSFSLLEKGLYLFDEPQKKSGDGIKKVNLKPTKTNKSKSRKNSQKSTSIDLTQHFVNNKEKSVKLVKKSEQEQENINKTVEFLNRVDRKCAPNKYTDEIIDCHKRALDSNQPHDLESNKKNKTEKNESIFTDEDFERMNEEWLKLY